MATANFIVAAKAGNKKPVVLLEVESVSSINELVTTKADWESGTLTNINTATQPGDAFLTTDGTEVYPGEYTTFKAESARVTAANQATTVTGLETPSVSSVDSRTVKASVNVNIWFYDTFSTGEGEDTIDWTRIWDWVDVEVWGSLGGGGATKQSDTTRLSVGSTAPKAFMVDTYDLARGSWTFTVKVVGGSYHDAQNVSLFGGDFYAEITGHTDTHETQYKATGSVVAPVIDMGVIPSEDSVLSIDDTQPAGATLTYTVKGGNSSPPTTSLGSKGDGDTLSAYQYYEVTASFTASGDGLSTPTLKEIGISGGNAQFERFGTHRDTPTVGTRPLLPDNPLSSLSSKIDLRKIATTGEGSVKMLWNAESGDLLATGFLKNKRALVKLGLEGLSSTDFEPVFTGTWYDYTVDEKSGRINVKLRDVLKRFQKVKIPEETFNATTGAKETTPQTWTEANVIQAMLDIIDLLGIPDRFIDRASFNTLRDSVFTGNAWKVTRTITKPVEAWKLLGELSTLTGVFLVPQGDGKLTPVQYDAAASSVATLDASVCDFGAISGGMKELHTRQYIYYDPTSAEPGESADDYNKGYALLNADAETDWDETAEQNFYDKWKLGYVSSAWTTTGHQNLATRWDGWFANPRAAVKASNCPLWLMDVQPGQVVDVDGLKLPVPTGQWSSATTYTKGQRIVDGVKSYTSLQDSNLNKDPATETTWWEYDRIDAGVTDAKRFLVMGKTTDPTKCLIHFNLLEMP